MTDENGNIVGKDYSTFSVWTGPVHYHGPQNPGPNGYIGYMAGESGNDMGPTLTAVAMSNNIIQDFRKYKDLEKLSFDYSLLSNSWSNLGTAQKLQNNLVGLNGFFIDNPHTLQDIEEYMVKSFSNSSNRAMFGDMYTSMDGSGNTRFAFSAVMLHGSNKAKHAISSFGYAPVRTWRTR